MISTEAEKLVSVIVPIYKSEKYLDCCIQSIVKQTYKKIEVILVDDGSPDMCPVICDCWKEKDKRVRVIHKKNGGLPDARNAGVEIGLGAWLLFIDSDDVIPTNFVEMLMKECINRKQLIVSKKIRFVDELPRDNITKISAKSRGKDIISYRGGLYVWGVLYSREIVDKIGLKFDSSLKNLEDVIYNGIYLRYINEVICVDVPYYYRINPTAITSNCGNSRWQIASWIVARSSLMHWFKGKKLTRLQMKEVKGLFRHCQNNIYAECLNGEIGWKELRVLEGIENVQFSDLFCYPIERFVKNHMPSVYYLLYVMLLRIKYYMESK